MLELLVDLTITGEFAPEEITVRLNRLPSVAWRKGDLIPKTIICRPSDGWRLESGTSRQTDIPDQISTLFQKLENPFVLESWIFGCT